MSKLLFTVYYPVAYQGVEGRLSHLFLLKDRDTGNSFTFQFARPGISPIVPVIWTLGGLDRHDFTCNANLDLPSFCVNPTPAYKVGFDYSTRVLTLGVQLASAKLATKVIRQPLVGLVAANLPPLQANIELFLGESPWYENYGMLQRASVMA
jgi:hypothetical protein